MAWDLKRASSLFCFLMRNDEMAVDLIQWHYHLQNATDFACGSFQLQYSSLEVWHSEDFDWYVGVVGILGSTYTGEYEDIAGMDKVVSELNKKNGWNVGIHVDAASGSPLDLSVFSHSAFFLPLWWTKKINVRMKNVTFRPPYLFDQEQLPDYTVWVWSIFMK